MIPEGAAITGDLELVQEPSRTYKMDLKTGRISGMIDGLEAVRQAVFKILQTERFEYLIYDTNYGAEMRALIDKPKTLVETEAQRRITEALEQDDRILDVLDFEFDWSGDSALITFTVISNQGTFDMQQEVG